MFFWKCLPFFLTLYFWIYIYIHLGYTYVIYTPGTCEVVLYFGGLNTKPFRKKILSNLNDYLRVIHGFQVHIYIYLQYNNWVDDNYVSFCYVWKEKWVLSFIYIYTPGVGVDFLCVGVGCVFFSKLDPFKSNLESWCSQNVRLTSCNKRFFMWNSSMSRFGPPMLFACFGSTLPETNIAHEYPIFPGKYHQNHGFSMAMLC